MCPAWLIVAAPDAMPRADGVKWQIRTSGTHPLAVDAPEADDDVLLWVLSDPPSGRGRMFGVGTVVDAARRGPQPGVVDVVAAGRGIPSGRALSSGKVRRRDLGPFPTWEYGIHPVSAEAFSDVCRQASVAPFQPPGRADNMHAAAELRDRHARRARGPGGTEREVDRLSRRGSGWRPGRGKDW